LITTKKGAYFYYNLYLLCKTVNLIRNVIEMSFKKSENYATFQILICHSNKSQNSFL